MRLVISNLASCHATVQKLLMGWFGVVTGYSRSWAMPPFDRAHTTSYSTLIETMCLSFTVFTARCYASAVLAMGRLCPSVSVCLSVPPYLHSAPS